MIEQRLQQRLRLLLAAPTAVVLLVAALAVTTARSPGAQPREAVFDLFARLEPRPATPARTVVIDIDEESVRRLGPWPWPRTRLAELVTAAEGADAASVTLAVPTEGPDPLSPDVIGRYWLSGDRVEAELSRVIAALPGTDVALAAAASGVPTAFGLSAQVPPASDAVAWVRTDLSGAAWLRPAEAGGFLALPAARPRGVLSPALSQNGVPAVIGLPADPDGRVRRVGALWSASEQPALAAGLAPLAAEGPLLVAARGGTLRVGGNPPAALGVGGAAGERILPLDGRGTFRLWLPADTAVESVPAWRVLRGGEQWTRTLEGRHVLVGETVTGEMVDTARGGMPTAAAHALVAEQAMLGAVPVRPAWAGWMEALLALLLGALAVALAVFAVPMIAAGTTLLLTALGVAGAFLVFRGTGLLIDPVPPVLAMIGGQLAVLGTVVGHMLVRDDAVRGAFHGALPPATMTKLQSRGGASLLRGTRRDVTVLSCALRLPPRVTERFEGRPDDFVRFMAQANDALRRTILSHQGTVDHAENGHLLGYWNVPEASPNHIEHACACALKMIEDVTDLSENVAAAALAGESAIDAGLAEGVVEIGIASGPCFAGPAGIGARNRYTAIGETVGLATRLRARSTLYGPAIITDDAVFDALRHHYAFLDLDVVRLEGSAQSRAVYGLVGNPFLKASKAFRQLADTQRELLLSWRSGDLAAATLQLQRLRALPGVPDPYVALFEARILAARVAQERGERAAPEATLIV